MNFVPGEDPFGDGVVEGRAEEVAQQGHPAPRQLPPLGGTQGGGRGGVAVGEVMESVAGREKSLLEFEYWAREINASQERKGN